MKPPRTVRGVSLTKAQARTVWFLRELVARHGEPVTAMDLAPVLRQKPNSVRRTLYKLYAMGAVDTHGDARLQRWSVAGEEPHP